jgi:hypothetical protein
MRVELFTFLVVLSACSSQVSLGSQDEQAAATKPEGSVSPTEASVSTVDAALDTHALESEGSLDASSVDEHHADASPDAPHYDPCAGKACGAACTTCDPHDLGCVEPPGSKQCNPHQQCVTALVCP